MPDFEHFFAAATSALWAARVLHSCQKPERRAHQRAALRP